MSRRGRWAAIGTGYDDPAQRQALLAELNALPGIALRPDAYSKRPSFPLSALLSAETLRGFLTAMEGVVGRLRARLSPKQGRILCDTLVA